MESIRVRIRRVEEATRIRREGTRQAGADPTRGERVAADTRPRALAARLQVSRELMRVVTAVHDAAAGREAGLRRVPREDLDDAADRIGAVQRRSRPAHDLDAVDLLERDELERRNAQRRRADARAIDQQQRVIGGCAAQEQRARLAQAAGVVDVDSGQIGQQILHGGDLARLDVLARQHRRGPERVRDRLLDARGGDDHLRVVGRPGCAGQESEIQGKRALRAAARAETR